MHSSKLESVVSALVLGAFAAGCGAAAPDENESTTTSELSSSHGLSMTGSSNLTSVQADGSEFIDGSFTLTNNTGSAVTLNRSLLLFGTPGGFSYSVGDWIAQTGSFFGIGPNLSAATTPYYSPFNWNWSVPVTDQFYRLDATNAAGPLKTTLSLPVLRSGFAAPPPSVFGPDTVIGLQTPIEVVKLTTGEHWLSVVGQVIETTATAFNYPDATAKILDAQGKVISTEPLYPQGGIAPLWPIFGAEALPVGAVPATLRVDASITVGSTLKKVTRTVPIVSASPVALSAPISGRWLWNNGQGENVYHTHFQFPEQRYAYDLLIEKTVSGFVQSYSGDPTVNTSYFAFGKPVHAALAGTVVEVVDDVPDNFGNQWNFANDNPRRNSHVIVQSAGGIYTMYLHVRQGSALVQAGQTVHAGQVLAQVGNAGYTTEPHLHFAVFKLDASGRVRALPINVNGLKNTSGTAVSGVPQGAVEFVSP